MWVMFCPLGPHIHSGGGLNLCLLAVSGTMIMQEGRKGRRENIRLAPSSTSSYSSDCHITFFNPPFPHHQIFNSVKILGWLQASSKILPFYQNKAIPHPPSHCNVPSESSAFLLHIYKVQCVFHNINMTEKYKYMHALPPPPAVLWVLVVAKFLRAPEVCLGAACVCVHKVIIWISSWRDTFRVITWIVNCVESTVDGSDEQMIK